MSMSGLRRTFGLAVLALACAAPAWAEPFVNPPERSGYPWSTPFPYQRNILWNFDESPVGGPSSDGTPGAHYEGTDDAILRVSDFVEFTGAVQWYATVPGVDGGGAYTGVIGIDNRGGNTELTGTVVFHLDNHDRRFEEKHVWVETTSVSSLDSEALPSLAVPAGFLTQSSAIASELISSDPLLFRSNYWFGVRPNPPWEELRYNFTVAAGGFAFFDSIHVATECVPEPSSLLALGTGLIGLAGHRYRRRRSARP